MQKLIKLISFPFMLLTGLFIFTTVVSAQEINYHTYKYGTHQTSMADGYYARPAQVTVDSKQYLVTMIIRTKKSLSPYPVQVLTIDGQAPLNVVKTRHGSDYDYRYSFRTNNLKREISSQIKIDVPHVYQATHNISFAFDTSHLPQLTPRKKKQVAGSRPVNRTNSNQAKKVVHSNPKIVTAQNKQAAQASRQIAQNARNQRDNQRHQRLFYYVILGGILSAIVLIGIAALMVVNAKERKK
ncbi:NEAT domain-containing protein [uncultured Lactobacillus sp.]|uniref:NEAT domain-containing protein n=1 Tax=uncultured Lactobacillus sp. TaxID=153152 RepID=UPI002639FF75|nr:NEAT domain-containing protein [uncultured Lactobacillus sp.]